ncbi:MAG: hypothetical protein ACRDS0_27290 [Pseudonocardiaceae bacterium]
MQWKPDHDNDPTRVRWATTFPVSSLESRCRCGPVAALRGSADRFRPKFGVLGGDRVYAAA